MPKPPGGVPTWASDETNNDIPTAGQKATGWTPNQVGVSDYDNWFKNETSKWLAYLNAGAFEGGVSIIGGAENVYTPVLTAYDWNSRVRATIDHLGYRSGAVTDWVESWRTTGTTAPVGWTAHGGGGTVAVRDPDTAWNTRYLRASLLSTLGSTGSARTEALGYLNTNLAFAAEWDLRAPSTVTFGTNNVYQFGFTCSNGGAWNNNIFFRVTGSATANITNWWCIKIAAGIPDYATDADSGVLVAANTKYKMRIEVIGSAATGLGGGSHLARWFINGTLVHTLQFTFSPNADPFALSFAFLNNSGTASPQDWEVGPVRLSWNNL